MMTLMYGPSRASATRAAALGDEALMAGSITLGEVAERVAVLAVACSRCERAGRYKLDTLIARHGAEFGIPDLLRLLSDDCPKRASVTVYGRCGFTVPSCRLSFWARVRRRPRGFACQMQRVSPCSRHVRRLRGSRRRDPHRL